MKQILILFFLCCLFFICDTLKNPILVPTFEEKEQGQLEKQNEFQIFSVMVEEKHLTSKNIVSFFSEKENIKVVAVEPVLNTLYHHKLNPIFSHYTLEGKNLELEIRELEIALEKELRRLGFTLDAEKIYLYGFSIKALDVYATNIALQQYF